MKHREKFFCTIFGVTKNFMHNQTKEKFYITFLTFSFPFISPYNILS